MVYLHWHASDLAHFLPFVHQETREAFEIIIASRKTWKWKNGEIVWPPHIEAALLERALLNDWALPLFTNFAYRPRNLPQCQPQKIA